jgi:hypothetical protein
VPLLVDVMSLLAMFDVMSLLAMFDVMSLLAMFAPPLHIWKLTPLLTTTGRRILLGREQMFCVLIKDSVSDSDYTTSKSKAPDKLSAGKVLK